MRTIRRNDGLLANIVVHPTMDFYDYYVVVVGEAGKVKFKLWIYTMDSDDPALFSRSTWKNDNELVFTLQSEQVEITVFVEERKATVRRLTKHIPPPFYFRTYTGDGEKGSVEKVGIAGARFVKA